MRGRAQAEISVDPHVAVLDAAHAVVSEHVPTGDGFCAGCQQLWDRLVWHPCEQGRWAVAVIETHGAVTEIANAEDQEAPWASDRAS